MVDKPLRPVVLAPIANGLLLTLMCCYHGFDRDPRSGGITRLQVCTGRLVPSAGDALLALTGRVVPPALLL